MSVLCVNYVSQWGGVGREGGGVWGRDYLNLLRCACGVMPIKFRLTVPHQAVYEVAGGIGGGSGCGMCGLTYFIVVFLRQ